MNFSQTQLSAALQNAVAQLGYNALTPVQQQVLPAALAGRDLLICAQTGSGKTAAFGLPVIEQLLQQPVTGMPMALVLTPTRELAIQVAEQLQLFASNTALRVQCIYGGANFKVQRQAMIAGVDILVATPGRLFDHLSQSHLHLNSVRYWVMDEADRLFDMGFRRDIMRLQQLLPTQRQTMMLSATFPQDIRTVAANLLHKPQIIEIPPKAQTQITQQGYLVAEFRKNEFLAELIGRNNWQQTLVFVNTKAMADSVCAELQLDGINAAVLHGDKTQAARQKALVAFAAGSLRVLVATDVAARGLDIEALPRVVNLQLPTDEQDFVHRIGRTGRAGQSGVAISIICAAEQTALKAMAQLVGAQIHLSQPSGYEITAALPERYRQAANEAKKTSNSAKKFHRRDKTANPKANSEQRQQHRSKHSGAKVASRRKNPR